MDAAKLAIALRDVERSKIILDRSVVIDKDHKFIDGVFGGFRVPMIDAFKLQNHLDEIEKFLRELANEN